MPGVQRVESSAKLLNEEVREVRVVVIEDEARKCNKQPLDSSDAERVTMKQTRCGGGAGRLVRAAAADAGAGAVQEPVVLSLGEST